MVRISMNEGSNEPLKGPNQPDPNQPCRVRIRVTNQINSCTPPASSPCPTYPPTSPTYSAHVLHPLQSAKLFTRSPTHIIQPTLRQLAAPLSSCAIHFCLMDFTFSKLQCHLRLLYVSEESGGSREHQTLGHYPRTNTRPATATHRCPTYHCCHSAHSWAPSCCRLSRVSVCPPLLQALMPSRLVFMLSSLALMDRSPCELLMILHFIVS